VLQGQTTQRKLKPSLNAENTVVGLPFGERFRSYADTGKKGKQPEDANHPDCNDCNLHGDFGVRQGKMRVI